MFLDFVQGDTSHDSRTYKLQNEEFRNWKAQSIELRFCKFLNEAQLGMAMGRVRGGFLDARTRPAGPPLLPEPGLFIKRVFFLAPKPGPSGPVRPRGLQQPL